MSIFSPDKISSLLPMPLSTDFPPGRKPDLRKVGRDIYEVLTNTGRHGYKQRMRKRTIKIEPERKLRARRGRSDPKRELRRCIAAHAEDEGRGRFGDADAAIQAGQEEAAHQRQESVGVPQISMGNLQLDSRGMKHRVVQNSACFPCSPLSQRLAYLRLSEQPRIESNADITNNWNKVGSLQRKHPHQLRQSRSAQDRHHQE